MSRFTFPATLKFTARLALLAFSLTILFTAGATAVQAQNSDGTVNVMDFGATGTGTGNDCPAIQNAIDSFGSGGGTVLFPSGHTFRCETTLNLDNKNSIHLVGTGGGQSEQPRVTLSYVGAGAADDAFISLRNTRGIEIRNLHIASNNVEFDGMLASTDQNSTAQPGAQLLLIDYCAFSGTADNKALLRLNEAISSKVTNSRFVGGKIGILGRDEDLNLEYRNYSNKITIDNNFFAGQVTTAIKNAGEAWLIQNCTFEPLLNKQSGAYRQDLGYHAMGLSFINNWFGDVEIAGGIAIEVRANGFIATGNLFSSPDGLAMTTIKLHSSEGVSITGNQFYGSGSVAIDLTSSTSFGVHIAGNNFRTQPAEPIVNRQWVTNLVILGNSAGNGQPYPNSIGGSLALSGHPGTPGSLTVTGNVTAAGQIISSAATGTAPLSVASTTQVPNLNASFLGGNGPGAFVLKSGDTMTGGLTLPENGLSVGNGQLLMTGGNVVTYRNLIAAGENTYFSLDTGLNRIGFTKKPGFPGFASFAAGSDFTIAQSSGSNIAASNTFTPKLTVNGAGASVSGNLSVSGSISNGAVSWTHGAGVPTGGCATGSLYTRTGGGAGSTLYVCEAGAWAAK